MPCDRIYTTSVNLNVANRDLLVNALRELRMDPVIHLDGRVSFNALGTRGTIQRDGRLTIEAAVADRVVRQITQAYSAECVKHACAHYGWRTTQHAPNQFLLTRRR